MAAPSQETRPSIPMLVLLGIVCDWAIKKWVLANLIPAASWVIWPGVLSLTRTHNTGAAFSLFQEHPAVLLVTAMVTLTVMSLYIARKPQLTRVETWGYACVFAGALGNLLDRVIYGSVTDYIHVVLVRFPVFNLADIFICTGVTALMIEYLGGLRHDDSRQ